MTTTFVLGAAANFGHDNNGQWPLGWQLAIRIQNQIATELNEQTNSPQGHIGIALSYGDQGLIDAHVDAMRRIENSIVYKDSIDDLVNEWSDQPKLHEVAKVCIANEILKSEATTQICAAFQGTVRPAVAMRQSRDSWLGKLLRYANPGTRRRDVCECLSGIKFVTFNYDRCLEATLLAFLHFGQDIPLVECKEIIDSIDIFHAYGCLGTLPELSGGLRYGGIEAREVYWASKKIRTYSEELDSGQADKIRNVISASERMVFMGFGYHEQNLNLLFGDKSILSRACFGTAVEMSDAERSRINRHFHDHGGTINLQPLDCHTLIDTFRSKIF